MRPIRFGLFIGPAVLVASLASLACLTGACSASGDGATGIGTGAGTGNSSGSGGSDDGGGGSLPPLADGGPGSSADGGPGPSGDAATGDSSIADSSKPDTYVPPGGAGVTITAGGTTMTDATAGIRRNTAVGGGSGGSDGTSYSSADLNSVPNDTSHFFVLNSESNYVHVGDYPCGAAHGPGANQSYLRLDFFSVPGGTAWESAASTCTFHVLTVSADAKPRVTGTITGTMHEFMGSATTTIVGTFDLTYSN